MRPELISPDTAAARLTLSVSSPPCRAAMTRGADGPSKKQKVVAPFNKADEKSTKKVRLLALAFVIDDAAPALDRARFRAQRLGSGDAQPEGAEQCSGRRSPPLGPWTESQRGQNTQATSAEEETGALIAAALIAKQAKAEALAQGSVEEEVEAPITPRVDVASARRAAEADNHALDAVCSWLLSLGLRETVVDHAKPRLRQEEIFSIKDLFPAPGLEPKPCRGTSTSEEPDIALPNCRQGHIVERRLPRPLLPRLRVKIEGRRGTRGPRRKE